MATPLWAQQFSCTWINEGRLDMSGLRKDVPVCLKFYLTSIRSEEWTEALEMIQDGEGHCFADETGIVFSEDFESSSKSSSEEEHQGPLPEDEVAFFAGCFPKDRVKKTVFLGIMEKCLEERKKQCKCSTLDGEEQFLDYVHRETKSKGATNQETTGQESKDLQAKQVIQQLEQTIEDKDKTIAALRQELEKFQKEKDQTKLHGDLQTETEGATACSVKKDNDNGGEIGDLGKKFEKLSTGTSGGQTEPSAVAKQQRDEGYLLFEEAFQKAFETNKLPTWPPVGEDSRLHLTNEMDETSFVNLLKVSGEAKAKFNNMCKKKGNQKQKPGTWLGNRSRWQAIHPPEVAIPAAVKVYKKALNDYVDKGILPNDEDKDTADDE